MSPRTLGNVGPIVDGRQYFIDGPSVGKFVYRHEDGTWDYDKNGYWDHTRYDNASEDKEWHAIVDRQSAKRLAEGLERINRERAREAEPTARALEQVGFGQHARRVVQDDEGQPVAGMTAAELIASNIPPREVLMHENGQPLFYAQSRNQIIAWRGVGKTMFSLAQAGAFCSGGKVLDFQASRECRVMYVDGELPAAQLQERVGLLVPETARKNLYLVNAEFTPNATKALNLAAPKTFTSLLEKIDRFKPDVLFLDSRSTLFPGKQLDEGHLGTVEERMQTLRLRKLCIIENHHVGKNGLQRGLSNNDDGLDIQVKLDKVDGWEPGMGLQFKLQYEKIRHQAQLEGGYAVALVGGKWQRVLDPTEAQIVALHQEGKSNREIGKQLEMTHTTVGRIINRWKAREAKRKAEPAVEVGF